MLLTLFKQCL